MNIRNTLSHVVYKTTLAIGFAALLVNSVIRSSGAEDQDEYAQKLSQAHLFLQPLVWVGDTAPDTNESFELYAATGLDPDHKPADRVSSMEAYVNGHPNSPWTPSLRANLAAYFRTQGRYGTALDYWQKAWDATKDSTDPKARKVADYTLAYWSDLLSSLGRIEKLQELIKAVNGRQMSSPEFQKKFEVAQQSAAIMNFQPGKSFRCGSVALFHVARALNAKTDFSSLAEMDSPVTGFSLAQLMEFSDQFQLGLKAVKRMKGTELVVPSLVHWKEDHYAAIVEKQNGGYRVIDPTFGRPQWLSAQAINENATGYFLVPTNAVPSGWNAVKLSDAGKIFGKGLVNAGEVPPLPRCDAQGNPCTTGTCTNDCPPGSGGGGGNGPGGGGILGCKSCMGGGLSGTASGGMPDWEVQEPFISLWLHDRPMFYNMSFGRQFSLQMDYHQRETRPSTVAAYNIANFGPNWNCNLLTYIVVDGTATQGTETITNCDSGVCTNYSQPYMSGDLVATEYSPDGGEQIFAWGGTNTSYTTTNPITHIQFAPATTNEMFTSSTINDYITGNIIHYTSNTLVYPNGSVATFGLILHISDMPEKNVAFLTSATDPQGHVMTYSYFTNSTEVLLTQVVDFDGKTNLFKYDNGSFPTAITQVTNRSYGLTVNYKYDGNGFLTNIVDVAGISSSFQYLHTNDLYYTNYDSYGAPSNPVVRPTWILTRLKTPYGDTTFDYFHPSWELFGSSPDGNINRAITVTQPDTGKHLFLFRNYASYMAQSYPALTAIPAGDFLANYLIWQTNADLLDVNRDNSFYWGPRQYAELTTTVLTNLSDDDFVLARMRNWLHADPENTLSVGQTLNVEQGFSPDKDGTGVPHVGLTVWYGYDGKTGPGGPGPGYTYLESTNEGLPVSMAYELNQGHAAAAYQNTFRNSLGKPTKVVDFGMSEHNDYLLRTNSYVYTANNVDLIAHIGPDGVVQEGYTYDGNHQVIFKTNALLEVTKYTYNGIGNVTSITMPNNLVTTNIYGADGFLATTYDYSGSTGYRTNTYTYINGLVRTHTDERGLTTTNSWDSLQRIKEIDFPDNTSITYTYSNLDLVRVIDRMGFTNSYAYDSMRRKTGETNALGHATVYTYCTCGSLDAVQDALLNQTRFTYDGAGRLTNSFYADGSWAYRSNNSAGMLQSVMSSSGKNSEYIYDGLMRNTEVIAHSEVFDPSPIAFYSYDLYDVVVTQVDANSVSLSMTYDALHRVRTRTYPDTGVEGFGYTPNIAAMTSYTNQLNNVWTYSYDLLSRKTNEIALSVYTNSFFYGPAGDLLTLVDGKIQTNGWKYDLFGRVTNKLDNLGTNLFVYGYDADNRLTTRTSAAKGTTAYSYDNGGNLTLINYPVSPDITFQYDAMNRLTNMVDVVGTNRYSYDVVGQVLSEDGPWDNDTVSYRYSNRLRTGLSVSAPNASPWVQSYAYDFLERIRNVTSPAGSFGYFYGLLPMTPYTDPGSLVRRLSLPNGAYIANSYDNVARLTGTYLRNSSDANLDTQDYVYNVGGQRTQQVFTAGNYVDYTYDAIGELKTALGKEPTGTTNRMQERFGYTYDAVGNLNYRTNNTLLQQFNVNSLNELTTVTNGGKLTVAGATTSPATSVTVNTLSAILYADASFASTNQSWANGNNTYTAIAQDSYGRKDTNIVTVNLQVTNTYAYDLNGNMLTNGTRVLEYDDENQLVRITEPNMWKSEFTYDGKMRRRVVTNSVWGAGVWVKTNEVHYVYDGNLVVQERDGNNLPQVSYTRGRDLGGSMQGAGGIGGLLARTDMGMWAGGSGLAHAFYHADGNGNIVALVYTNQSIAAKYEYDPFGNISSRSGQLADVNRYRFSSKESDIASDLIYYLYRYYEPNLQRWQNRDPYMEHGFESIRNDLPFYIVNFLPTGEYFQNPNIYTFVANNPVIRTDANGLILIPCPISLVLGCGARCFPSRGDAICQSWITPPTTPDGNPHLHFQYRCICSPWCRPPGPIPPQGAPPTRIGG